MHFDYDRASHARSPTLLRNGALAALGVHSVFLAIFAAIGEAPLAWANVLSVAIYALVARWAERGRVRAALVLVWIEVVAHVVAAEWRLGWETGFHYYLIVLLGLLFLGPLDERRHRLRAVVAAAALWGLCLALHVTVAGRPAPSVHDPRVLALLRYFNLAVTFALLTYLWMHFSGSVRSAEQGLLALASTDALSGLGNRRSAIQSMQQAMSYAERSEGTACLILADIDNFKRLNDEHGHDAGDRAIVQIGELLQSACRTSDHVARWGGEEFLVVLPATDVLLARAVAQRIHDALAERPLLLDGRSVPVTLTQGVAAYVADESPERWVARADAALYRGKRCGKNRTELATALEATMATPGERAAPL